jgi:lysophospholipase L1-like esterase
VAVGWFNDPITSEYDHTVTGGPGYNNVGAFSFQVNAAPGGTAAPTAGWVTVASIASNRFNSAQRLVNMTGYNWIRINVTASDGSPGNTGVSLNMDVHDASAGVSDDWMFYGDSITQDGMSHDRRTASSGGSVGTFAEEVNARAPAYFPLYQDGGIGGLRSSDGAASIQTWLASFPGKWVTLNYGTNDASAGAGDPGIAKPFHDNMKAMAQAVIAAGKTPIIPTIPWGRTAELRANVPVLNQQIANLRAEIPAIVAGPDLYAYFNTHQSLISPDGIHPTYDNGYAAMRQQWAAFGAALGVSSARSGLLVGPGGALGGSPFGGNQRVHLSGKAAG